MTNHPLDDVAQHEARLCPTNDKRCRTAIDLVTDELKSATAMHGPQRSAHEGYAVLLEEVDELWDEIKKKDKIRSKAKMLAEAKQIAAMAIRFMVDICPAELDLIHQTPVLVADTLFADQNRILVRNDLGVVTYTGPERRKGERRKGNGRRGWSHRQHVKHYPDGTMNVFSPALRDPILLYSGQERRDPRTARCGRRVPGSDRRGS